MNFIYKGKKGTKSRHKDVSVANVMINGKKYVSVSFYDGSCVKAFGVNRHLAVAFEQNKIYFKPVSEDCGYAIIKTSSVHVFKIPSNFTIPERVFRNLEFDINEGLFFVNLDEE